MTDALRPSKTRRKKAMHDLQQLGAELVELNEARLVMLELPAPLHEAVTEAKRIASFEARRRQLQYIGKLMRSIDPEPIRKTLEAWRSSAREQNAVQHRIEHWRERLIEDEHALGEFLERWPEVDAQRLRSLVRAARHERATAQPPRSYRALFKFLRDTLAPAGQAL